MPDLRDGESIEMQGSGSKPYTLKNVGGVYSCSCPAWRNQSIAIERRTCKHLRKLRGDAAEDARIGGPMPAPAKTKDSSDDSKAPPLLLAESWDNIIDPTGWWLSEKLDGVRAYWDGSQFWSRLGNRFHAPAWFVAGLPDVPLDGELWIARKQFQRTVSIVRRQDQSDHWKEVRYVVFDAPKLEKDFEKRLAFVRECLTNDGLRYALAHDHQRCQGLGHLRAELDRLETLGGEGLMLRRAGSRYESGRSATLLKVKRFHDAEARVLQHLAGAGRHKGRLGALLVEMSDGTTFSVGTGFSDAERESPPPVGSFITYRYQELSDAGVPRFPSYVGIRADQLTSPPSAKAAIAKTNSSNTVRRFEFSEGNSNKFWEIAVQGVEVTVRYGRVGSSGQTKVKSFSDGAAAVDYADKLVDEKTAKGYQPVGQR
jgi:DNA ligase-1